MRLFAVISLILVVPGMFAAFAADDSDEGPQKQLAAMSWLAGNWSGEMWGGIFSAHYSLPNDGMILSVSELATDGKVGYHEFERFDVKDGAVRMSPYPKGRPAGTFKLTKLDGKKAIFDNPKKDFPTRITYHRKSEKELEITLSDPHGKSDKTEVFKLERE